MDNDKKTYSDRQHDILFAVYAFLVLGLFTICVYLMIAAIASPSLSSTMIYGVAGVFVGIASLSSGEWMLPTLEKMFIKEQRKMVNNNSYESYLAIAHGLNDYMLGMWLATVDKYY